MGTREFYGYYRSSASYRLRIALNLKGLTAKEHYIHLRDGDQFAPDYVKLNPQQQVPTIVEEDGSVLVQSPAILEFLEETHPEPPLLPEGAVARARVRAIAAAIGCDIHPINNLRVLKYLRQQLGQDEDGVKAWIHNWVRLGFDGVEAMLAGSDATGALCHGDSPTMADVYLAPQVYNAERFDYPIGDHPTIAQVYANAMALDAFEKAYPDSQPDAE